MIVLFIILPFVLAAVLPLIEKLSRRFLPDLLTNAGILFLLIYTIGPARQMFGARQLQWFNEPLNMVISLDSFSLFILFTIYLVSFGVTLFSIDYMEHYTSKGIFYALFLIMIGGMSGLVLAVDLFTIYIFLEIAAISSYGLVAYGLGHDELEASFKYLMLSAVATAFLLLGITLIFGISGNLQLDSIARTFAAGELKSILSVCIGFFIFGFGLKAALVPFHSWLPDAHPSAPAPISAMLSGLLIKVSGVYALTRIFLNVFGLTPALSGLLMYLGIISILVGALLALGQSDIKRMLAYSSISQVGYIILGIGAGTKFALMGALFHILNHALAKGLLFLNSGSVEHATGTRDLNKMGGLGRKLPVTTATSVVGSLAVSGVPPLNGFWSKLFIIIGLFEARAYGFAFIAILASVVTLWYYIIIQRRAFFGKLNQTWREVKEVPFWMALSTIFIALVCIIFGIAFPFILSKWIAPAAAILKAGVLSSVHNLGL
ncbi:MAG: proton-conducting transporter membrane subunit [candidate division WOR-3 bacterium]